MNDSEGKEIKLGHQLQSSLFKSADMVWVIGITDMTIIMIHEQPGAYRIELDQNALDQSKWVIAGFKKVPEERQ